MCTHGEKGNRKTQDKLRICATKRTIPWAMPSGPAEAASLRQERRPPPTKAVPEFLRCERCRAHGLSAAFGVIAGSGKAMVVRDMAASHGGERRAGARQAPRLVPPADLTTTGQPMLARGSELRGSS